jgi:hypothetical protein
MILNLESTSPEDATSVRLISDVLGVIGQVSGTRWFDFYETD